MIAYDHIPADPLPLGLLYADSKGRTWRGYGEPTCLLVRVSAYECTYAPGLSDLVDAPLARVRDGWSFTDRVSRAGWPLVRCGSVYAMGAAIAKVEREWIGVRWDVPTVGAIRGIVDGEVVAVLMGCEEV